MADIRSRVGSFIQGLAPSQQQAAQAVASANKPEESEQKTSSTAPVIGSPGSMAKRSDMPSAAMPQDLQQGYLRLNEFGSPLPQLGVLADHYVKAAQVTQDQMTSNEQMLMTGMMPQRGQLPVGMMQQPINTKGGRR
jgi:hypothetical protein